MKPMRLLCALCFVLIAMACGDPTSTSSQDDPGEPSTTRVPNPPVDTDNYGDSVPPPETCQSDDDCAFGACNENGRCVDCLDNSHCREEAPICLTARSICVECETNDQCGSGICNSERNRCEDCRVDSDCSDDLKCLEVNRSQGLECLACLVDDHCGEGFFCTDEQTCQAPEISSQSNVKKAYVNIGGVCFLTEEGEIGCFQNLYSMMGANLGRDAFKDMSSTLDTLCGLSEAEEIACLSITGESEGLLSFPEGPWLDVAAGSRYSCGLNNTGVYCKTFYDSEALEVLSGDYTQIASGFNMVCGLTTAGAVECVEVSEQGQLSSRESPFPGEGWDSIQGIDFDVCASKEGQFQCENQGSIGEWSQISGARGQFCGIDTEGQLRCWNQGTGDAMFSPAGTFMDVSLDTYGACAVREDGHLLCWGDRPFNLN